MHPPIGPLVTASEAAKILHIHPNTIKRIPPSELPFYRVSSRGDRRYEVAVLRQYLRDRSVKA